MMVDFIISVLGFAFLFLSLSFFAERVLVKSGYVRGNTLWLIPSSFILAIYKQVDFRNPLYVYILMALIAIPLIVNRYDMSLTIKQGKWWWKSEHNKK